MQDFWRLEMYEVCDIAALMKSVVDDRRCIIIPIDPRTLVYRDVSSVDAAGGRAASMIIKYRNSSQRNGPSPPVTELPAIFV